jgi:CheY-like chemotaxis protein
VAAWRAGAFDAVLMDMQMPGVDGLEATRTIRRLEAERGSARTPVIIVSANAMPEHVAAAYAAGADAHLAKPLSAERLFAALSAIPEPSAAAA